LLPQLAASTTHSEAGSHRALPASSNSALFRPRIPEVREAPEAVVTCLKEHVATALGIAAALHSS
jgi:hypothetical protein